jgi:hypothetical protein
LSTACGVRRGAAVQSLMGIAGVVTAERLAGGRSGLALGRPDRREALQMHSWEERVGRVLWRLGVIGPRESTGPAVVTRPAIHYGRGERRL